MKSESWIIIELLAAVLILTALGYFFIPAYGPGVTFGMQAIVAAFNMVIGYKFGRSMPEQSGDPKPGQDTKTEVSTKVTTASPVEPPKDPVA